MKAATSTDNALIENRIHDLLDGILELEMTLEDDSWREWYIGDPHNDLKAMKLELAEIREHQKNGEH